jgi:hypothetical protein
MAREGGRSRAGRFRLVLLVGAVVSAAVGMWGVFWSAVLIRVFGYEVGDASPGFDALGRMYGGLMVMVAVGYAIAVAQPERRRSLLAVLFMAPLASAVMLVAGVARGEIRTGQGVAWVVFYLAYCLVFFRLYPRVRGPAPSEDT